MNRRSTPSLPTYRQDWLKRPDGARIWYELRGSGGKTPVLLLDGLGCDGFVWRYLWEPLTRERTVLHLHHRGHGQSTLAHDPARIGIEFCCDDALAVLDAVGLPRPAVLGHSMGVQVALELHRLQPGRIAGLGLLCGSYGTPLDTWHDHTLLRVAFPWLRAAAERAPPFLTSLFSRLLKTELALSLAIRAELNPALVKRSDFDPYMEHLAKMDPVAFVRTLDSLKDHSAWEHLPSVDVPALVVGGEIDKFTPVWLAQRMAERIRGCEYLLVPGGSHTAPLERPVLVNGAVERLLGKLDQRAATAP